MRVFRLSEPQRDAIVEVAALSVPAGVLAVGVWIGLVVM